MAIILDVICYVMVSELHCLSYIILQTGSTLQTLAPLLTWFLLRLCLFSSSLCRLDRVIRGWWCWGFTGWWWWWGRDRITVHLHAVCNIHCWVRRRWGRCCAMTLRGEPENQIKDWIHVNDERRSVNNFVYRWINDLMVWIIHMSVLRRLPVEGW